MLLIKLKTHQIKTTNFFFLYWNDYFVDFSLYMNREAAIHVFNKGLDSLLGRVDANNMVEPIIQLCWFAEDFDNYIKDYIEEIFRRIENPPYFEEIKGLQPSFSLIALLDYFLKIPRLDKILITNRIPGIVQVIIRRKDEVANILLRRYIDGWTMAGYITPEIMYLIRRAFDTQIVAPWQQQEETINEEQSKFEETITETDDKQLKFRLWMLSSTQWERGKSEDLSSISYSNAPKTGNVRKYVRVTPNNETATCSVCSGKFKRINHPKYGIVFENVEFVKGSGYVHTGCLSHIRSFLIK